MNEIPIQAKGKTKSIIHQNVQSIGNSIDRLNDMLNTNRQCEILCITEHWKQEEQLRSLSITDFRLISVFCREEGKHGGSAVYSKKSLKCKARTKLNNLSISSVFECAAVECDFGKVKAIIVSIYRPPTGDIKIFMDKVEQVLVNIFNENKLIFIVGDFNIELLKENKLKTELLSLFNSFNVNQTIFENTRITDSGGSCVDNIFTNSNFVQANAFENYVSDHTAQKIVFRTECPDQMPLKYKRFFSEENKNNFMYCLREQDWLDVYNVGKDDVNKQWNIFMNTFQGLFDQNFPRRLHRKKQKSKTYDNQDVIECKHRLDIMLTLARHDQSYKELYKNEKKAYDRLLVTARATKYENRITQSDNKIKCMWAICKEINGKHAHHSDIEVEGDPEYIANEYNKHLLSIVPELLNDLMCVPFNSTIKENPRSMFLKPVTPNEISEIAQKLKNKHSSGFDEVPTSIVKIATIEVKNVLCYIINNSFSYGVFPENLKIALIKPLYKKGDPENLDNYRPISLLPGFSKIFEVAMSERLVNFMNECNLFSNCQHGFIRGKSTQTAIFDFIKSVLQHLENDELALGLLLDLSKAYDCLDRDLLIRKLEMYGIRGNAKEWLAAYLRDRRQAVTITKGKSCRSEILPNNVGIAQGSILGPVLFIIFVNDLALLLNSPCHHLVRYADDTNLIIGSKKIHDLLLKAKDFVALVINWFARNKLILNRDKTNILLFRTKQSTVIKPSHMEFDNNEIEISNSAKFLGIHINEHLDWSGHINILTKKLNSICYGIRITGKYMNQKTLRILYFANFESILKYGILFWGGHSSVQRVFVVQKRVIRVIKKKNYLESCRTVFKELGIMTTYAIYIYECLMFFVKNKNIFDLTPKHNYSTRTLDVNYPIHRLALSETCPHYMCLKFFNALPERLKNVSCHKKFKIEVRKMLVDLEPYNLRDFCQNL